MLVVEVGQQGGHVVGGDLAGAPEDGLYDLLDVDGVVEGLPDLRDRRTALPGCSAPGSLWCSAACTPA